MKAPGGCTGVGGECADDGYEVKVSVADMEQDDAVGHELSVIQRECFPGQQVNRNAIGAESVDDDSVVELVGHVLEVSRASPNTRRGVSPHLVKK